MAISQEGHFGGLSGDEMALQILRMLGVVGSYVARDASSTDQLCRASGPKAVGIRDSASATYPKGLIFATLSP
jgi:hypothetical protein